MTVKELKECLAKLPEEANGYDVAFGSSEAPGLYVIDSVHHSCYDPDETPEGCMENFILLWSGERP